MKKINVAIDGTSGVGKSSAADLLAEKFGMIHLDTGAMYRTLALAILQAGIDLQDEAALLDLLENTAISFDENQHACLNGTDVSGKIRTEEISRFTSKISALPAVREKLVALQREISKGGGWIVDGRDIGTVVLPDAELKIYLTASPESRAERRLIQNQQMNIAGDYESILKDIIARDYQDMNREISPLKKAEDAIEVDTSSLSLEQVVDLIAEKMAAAGSQA